MPLEIPNIFPVTAHTHHVGPGSTFVAIAGKKQNGVDYIARAVAQGATTIVIEERAELPHATAQLLQQKNIQLMRVANTRLALAQLSAQALNYPAQKLTIIGITGTKGKTTTTFILEHLLRAAGHATALLSTIGNRIFEQQFPTALTTQQPDYLQVFLDVCVRAGVTHVVMEVSAQALSLHRLDGILFDSIIFTNFSQEHAEFYACQEDYFAAKKSLFLQLTPQASAFINVDDEYGKRLLQEYPQSISFGVAPPSQVRVESLQGPHLAGVIHAHNKKISLECPNLIGMHNLYNVLSAAAVALRYHVLPATITHAMKTFKGVPGRMELYQLPNGARCVIDYAHTPSAFQAILTTLRSMTDHLIVVFGCGGDRDPIKRPEMGRIAATLGDLVFVTSDNPRSEKLHDIVAQIMQGIDEQYKEKVVCEYDRQQAIVRACQASQHTSIVALLGKGPDEYEEVQGVKTFFSERAIIQER